MGVIIAAYGYSRHSPTLSGLLKFDVRKTQLAAKVTFDEMLWYADSPVYSHLDVVVGESVELLCNTSLISDIMWSYDTDDGFVAYVYRDLSSDNDKPRFSVKSSADGVHSLVIADAELSDSGLYNCYDGKGRRQVGYQLVVNGMC